MGRPSIQSGKWVTIISESHFEALLQGRVNKGEYNGNGNYLLLKYQQRCPKNCCYDDVVELISAKDVIYQVKEEIVDLAQILRTARANNVRIKPIGD